MNNPTIDPIQAPEQMTNWDLNNEFLCLKNFRIKTPGIINRISELAAEIERRNLKHGWPHFLLNPEREISNV